jgi:hypothetical protein
MVLARLARAPGAGNAEQISNDGVVDTVQEMVMSDDNPKTRPFSNAEKNPDDWTTGDEPMTGAQASYLKTLSEEAGESFDDTLTKADASKKIDSLQEQTGRGKAD